MENNKKLVNIDLSKNTIINISNLDMLPNLRNLDLSENSLTKVEQIEHLAKLKTVTTLNLSQNFIEYDDKIIEILLNME